MIFDKLVEIMMDHLSIQPQDVTMDTAFKDDLAVDSLDLYDLVMALEEEFNIEMPQDRVNDIETVEDLIKLLKELGVEE
ncbi:acyl carrier protein [Lachnospiraceae bacterium]|nr:acyl carrier protein [Eubacterium sp.]SNU06898.1 acyl carrier protein [Lachnospiraceae bacterium]